MTDDMSHAAGNNPVRKCSACSFLGASKMSYCDGQPPTSLLERPVKGPAVIALLIGGASLCWLGYFNGSSKQFPALDAALTFIGSNPIPWVPCQALKCPK
jgi:hypothetical protein